MNCSIECDLYFFDTEEDERRRRLSQAMFIATLKVGARRAQRALLTVLLETESTTENDIRNLVELPVGFSPNCFRNNVTEPLDRAGIICPGGFFETGRFKLRKTIWVLKDRKQAMLWLTEHPELPDPRKEDLVDDNRQETISTQETAMPMGEPIGAIQP